MSAPFKEPPIPWCEDDTNWFKSHPNSTFRLRRLSDKEHLEARRYIDNHRKVPTHVLLMLKPEGRYTVRCHDGAEGGFFDLLVKSLEEESDYDESCPDVLYAAIWGRTLLSNNPWRLDDLVRLTKLKENYRFGRYQCESL